MPTRSRHRIPTVRFAPRTEIGALTAFLMHSTRLPRLTTRPVVAGLHQSLVACHDGMMAMIELVPSGCQIGRPIRGWSQSDRERDRSSA